MSSTFFVGERSYYRLWEYNCSFKFLCNQGLNRGRLQQIFRILTINSIRRVESTKSTKHVQCPARLCNALGCVQCALGAWCPMGAHGGPENTLLPECMLLPACTHDGLGHTRIAPWAHTHCALGVSALRYEASASRCVLLRCT